MSASPDTRHDDLSHVREWLESLLDEGRKEDQLDIVVKLLEDARRENNALELRVKELLRALYGTKSERVSDAQLKLALEALTGATDEKQAPDDSDDSDDDSEVEQPKEVSSCRRV